MAGRRKVENLIEINLSPRKIDYASRVAGKNSFSRKLLSKLNPCRAGKLITSREFRGKINLRANLHKS